MTELLEQQLIELSQQFDVDVGDRLVADVLRRIDLSQATAAPSPSRSRFAGLKTRRRFTVAALALAGSIAAVFAVPDSRHAVADWFGIGSTRIDRTPDTGMFVDTASVPTTRTAGSGPSATVTTVTTLTVATTDGPVPTIVAAFPSELDLGQPISTSEARALTGLPVPVSDLLGTPSGVFVAIPPNAGQVIVVYPASAALPPSPVAGVGALLSAVSGRLDDGLFTKIASMGTTVEELSITVASGATVRAVWLAGEAHTYAIEDAEGAVLFDSLRLATNTLLWMEDGVVFRLEAELTRRQAIDIAATVIAAE